MADFFEKLTRSIKTTSQEKRKSSQKKVNFSDQEEPRNELRPKSLSPEVSAEEQAIEEEEEEGQLTVDVYQTENEIVIKSTIAGAKPENIDIDITSDVVTIKGIREKDEKISDENYFYQECYWGSFSRSIILPQDISPEKSEATMKNGILTIRLPKLEGLKTKKLRIKTSS